MTRRRRAKGKHRPPDPEDVLAGREPISVEELFDLIHRINPTGETLSGKEETRLYEQKSRLQSLLIRRFGDQHVVAAGTENPDVVSLVHRSGAKDACHAVLSQLAPDARSWVQLQLDIEASPPAADRGRPSGNRRTFHDRAGDGESAASPEDRLELAHKALKDYDYEAAEQHLRLALDQGGGVDAALSLLDLLVGLLGMDRQALEIEPRLSAEAAAHPGVRTCLALAAARLGESDRPLRLIKGIDQPRAADVYAALVGNAIRAHDPVTATRCLEQLAACDPTHPQIPSLTDEIANLQAENRRPAEEALLERYREEGLLAVEEDARALSARWPRSDVARRILREVAEHRREVGIAIDLEAADGALEREEYLTAARLFRKAREAGSDRPDLSFLIERAQRRGRLQEEERQVTSVTERFAASDPKAALLGYLALGENLRVRVRERVGRDHRQLLSRLDAAGAPPSGSKAHAAVAAVLALARAEAALRQGNARAAVDQLAPHRRALADVGEAGRVEREAEAVLASERRDRARQALAAAWVAYDAEQLERAGQLLDDGDLRELTAPERSEAEQLLARIRRSETLRQLAREYEHHVAAEDFPGARDRALKLVEASEDEAGRQLWSQRLVQLRRRISRAYRVEVVSDPASLAELRDVAPSSHIDDLRIWGAAAGTELLLVNTWERWLFVRVVDVERGAVLCRVSLRTAEPLGEPIVACVDGDRLRVSGNDGAVLEISRNGWEIARERSLSDLLAETIFDHLIILPETSYLWAQVRSVRHDEKTYVVDLEAWRLLRQLSGRPWLVPIIGSDEPRVAHAGFDGGIKLHSAHGAPVPDGELPVARRTITAAVSPDGNGLVLAVVRPLSDLEEDEDEDPEVELQLLERSPSGGSFQLAAAFELIGAFEDGMLEIATSSDMGLIFVVFTPLDSDTQLLALSVSSTGFAQAYRIPVPHDTVLVQDCRTRRVIALFAGTDSLQVLPLGLEPPPAGRLPAVPARFRERRIPDLSGGFFSCPRSGVDHRRAEALQSTLEVLSEPVRRQFVHQFVSEHEDDVDRLLDLYHALRGQEDTEEHRTWLLDAHLAERHAHHPGAALLIADRAAGAGQWEEVRRGLGAVDSGDLDDDRASHCHYLLGIALLHDRRWEEALEVLERETSRERGIYAFGPLIEVAKWMRDPSAASEWGPDQPLVRQLLGAIRTADRALEAGDAAAALATLDCSAVWQGSEMQSAARLAAASLETTPRNPAERFRKRLALAFFCDLHGIRHQLVRKELQLPGLAWDQPQLERIEQRARAWLDEQPEAAEGPRANQGKR
ncbi:MAG: hypothetical protein GY856_13765 [bacterium]|nr:hypothetical protein [bacterium]